MVKLQQILHSLDYYELAFDPVMALEMIDDITDQIRLQSCSGCTIVCLVEGSRRRGETEATTVCLDSSMKDS